MIGLVLYKDGKPLWGEYRIGRKKYYGLQPYKKTERGHKDALKLARNLRKSGLLARVIERKKYYLNYGSRNLPASNGYWRTT